MNNLNKDILLENEITEIITLINTYREEYEVPSITYSPELSIISRDVAINLLKSNIRKFEYLSNIDNSSLSRNLLFVRYARNQKMINIKNIINKWYKEEKYYNFDDETDMKYKNCKNFINLVLETNIKCGIGYSYANGKCSLCIHFSEE
jgi:hypothetical protein